VPVVTLAMSFRGATLRARITPRLVPSISSVQFRGKPSDPTIVVHGRGLAPLPPKSPSGSPAGHDGCPAESGVYGSDYGLLFNLNDLTKGWSAGAALLDPGDQVQLVLNGAVRDVRVTYGAG
jgi:hypothetical protein